VETACPGADASRTEVRRDEGVAAPGEGLDEHFSRLQLSLALAIGSSANHMEISGGCVCGGTRYVLKSRPSALVDCHCIDCRRSAGAAYVQWGSVPRKDLVVTKGEPRKIAYADRFRLGIRNPQVGSLCSPEYLNSCRFGAI
jgi:hypothetical protein